MSRLDRWLILSHLLAYVAGALAMQASAAPAPKYREPPRPAIAGVYAMAWSGGHYDGVEFSPDGYYRWRNWSGRWRLVGATLRVEESPVDAPEHRGLSWAAELVPGKLSGRLATGGEFALTAAIPDATPNR